MTCVYWFEGFGGTHAIDMKFRPKKPVQLMNGPMICLEHIIYF